MPSVLFRCDASPQLGGGHVTRCLTLAAAMKSAGHAVRFASTRESVATVSALAGSGISVIELEDPLDPEELLRSVTEPVGAIVLDHYGLDFRYERVLRSMADTVVVFDGVGDRRHDCDVLVAPTFGREAADYAHLVPEGASILAGAQYAPLRPEFAAARSSALNRRRRREPVSRIMISMGLTDVGAITIDVLDAVLAADTGAAIDVVLGSIAPSLEPVLQRAGRHSEVSVHVDTNRMCDLIAAADIGVGAGGTTTWERCCLGLPTVSIVLAENQRRLSEALCAAGAIMLADSQQAVGDAVRTLVRSPGTLHELSSAAAAVTDGSGSNRIIARIESAARADADPAVRMHEE